MAGRRARTGRGWDAAPARASKSARARDDAGPPAERGNAEQSERDRTVGRDRTRQPPPDPYEAAREICLRQLATRPRTRAELSTALRKRGIADEVAASVLDRYDEVGLIDDAAFAKAWVTSRHHGRGLARRALANELRQRGVEAEVANAALDDLDHDTEVATARALVDRKLRTMGSASPDAVFRRLVGMLARKGYPAGVAVNAVKEALAARAEAEDFPDQEASEWLDQLDAEDVGSG